MINLSRKPVFFIICACQFLVIILLIFMYFRNVEWNNHIYRFKCKSEQPFRYHSNRSIKLQLDIQTLPREMYTGKTNLTKGMVVYCTFRDVHGYHRIDNMSTKRPYPDEPFMKTRISYVYEDSYRLETNFSRYPLYSDRLKHDSVPKLQRTIVDEGKVVILDARISKRGTVYAKKLYVGDMHIEDYAYRKVW